MFENKTVKRVLSLLLCAALLLCYLPAGAIQAKAATPVYVEGSKKADQHTIDWQNFFGENKLDTEFAGAVWTDKSVFAGNSSELSGISLQNSDNFLIALSAMGSSLSITGHTSVPTDTMLVLDVSGSMVDDTYEVGTVRRNNNYRQVEGIDMSVINNMVKATNDAVAALMEQNLSNRVGVVLYSGNTSSNSAATPATATVVLPLGRYAGDTFLTVNATETTEMTYTYQNRRWTQAGQVTYVAEGTNVSVAVKSGLKTEAGGNVTAASKQVTGGTYIQNGLHKAMDEFLKVTDTVLPEGDAQAGKKRMPVLVLMSDGAPTIATTNATPAQNAALGNSNTGDGTGTTNRITFLTQLTAAYVRGMVAAHYGIDPLFLTMGLGTESSSAATDTLYPAGSGNTLSGAWQSYLAAQNGANVTLSLGGNLNLTRNSAVAAMNYVDKYFYASDAAGLIQAFEDVVGEIALKTASYATLVEGGNANFSGYVTFEDELGQLIHVHHMNGIRIGNKIFTGEEVARAMNDGTLGTVSGPLELGNELVATVKERIPGIDTPGAQQLIDHAYNDKQLYHDGTNWSNYIGWYGDANGNYVGFWDKDSGYENAPAGAIYANRSYGYLGEGATKADMMHVVVMVRTDLRTLHQTVYFKIPASLLPLVQYNVTLKTDDPNAVEKFERIGAEPMQLVYEVGLRSDINAVNLDEKIAEHLQRGEDTGIHTHVHRNNDGSVTLYTNQWKADNDTNGNGAIDQNEIEGAEVAEAHFHPALDNSRYYYTEDTLLRNADGTPVTGATRPTGAGYIHYRSIYSAAGKTNQSLPVSQDTLDNALRYDANEDRWYVVKGTMYHELGSFRTLKVNQQTDTLDYSDFPVAFENGEKQDVYNFLGNNGTVTIAPATGITLQKVVSGVIEGATGYTFRISVPAGVTPNFTDDNGDAIEGVTSLGSNRYSVVLAANEKIYITGIPAGQTVQVEELIGQNDQYYVKSVTGAVYANGVATATVPAATQNGGDLADVVFTNAPYAYGDLVISKEIVHELASDPAAMADKVFTFRVKLEGARIKAGDTYGNFTVDADGYLSPAITLKNDESITIKNLPAGTEFTVTEDPLAGFRLESINGQTATEAKGFIAENAESRADFVNRYPDSFTPVSLPVELNITKVLTENSPYTGNRTFQFLLQRYNGQGYDDEQTVEVTAGGTKQAAAKLDFASIGTYYFQIIEKPHDPVVNGMNYSTMRALFRVVVTDENMDGVLETKVESVANTTVTGSSVAATFVNIYQVNTVAAQLQVTKQLENDTGVEKSTSGFRFVMTPAGGLATGDPITVTSSAQGLATFNVLLTAEGTYTYTVQEEIPAGATLDPVSGKYVLNGMYYDATVYTYTVTATAVGSQLQITGESLTVDNAPVNEVRFVNEYILEETKVQLPYSKTANVSGTFTGILQQTDSTYQPLAGAQAERITLTPGQTGNKELTFQKAGTYHYTFTEEYAGQVIDGVHYDNAVYHITVQVSDGGNGKLTAEKTIHKVGVTAPVESMAFVNEYRITGEETVTIGGKKTLRNTAAVADRFLIADEFEMGLYEDSACTKLLEKAFVKADGTFAFAPKTYTPDDLGEYTFYVKEIDGGLGGVTYDPTVHEIKITVSHDKGQLKVTVTDDYDALQIENVYAADGVDVELKGEKVLAGDWTAVQNKSFTFQLLASDENFVITNDTPVKTATVDGAEEFKLTLRYEDGQEGYHYFVLKEQIPETRAGGVSYDAGEYHITVRVSDPGKGELTATVSLYRPGTGNTDKAVFTNRYEAAAAVYTPTATKVYKQADGTPVTQTDGQFNFVVLENGQPVSFGQNKADGTVVFEEITYTAPGVHNYTVVEYVAEGEEIEGVTYDETTFNITVTVTDDGLGKLTAVATGGQNTVFNNVFTPKAPDPTPDPDPTPTDPTPTDPVKPPAATPVTGDETNVVLWSFMAVFSMSGLFVLLLTGKKEQEAE